ncbi:MAG: methyl-accepting chemotaxis protein [Spirochaetia bacterium]|nr:methyl-accepting chemotaxis protein [Spirochaetia bacterium]
MTSQTKSIYDPILKRTTIKARLLLLLVLAMILPIILAMAFLRTTLMELSQTRKELRGMELIDALRPIRLALMDHRFLAMEFIRGDRSRNDELAKNEIEIAGHIEKIKDKNARHGEELGTVGMGEKLAAGWEIARTSYREEKESDANFKLHSDLVRIANDMILETGIRSDLRQDPDRAALHAILVFSEELPPVVVATGIERGLGSKALNAGKLDERSRIQLTESRAEVALMLRSAERDIQGLIEDAPEYKAEIEKALQEAEVARNAFRAAVLEIEKGNFEMKPSQYFQLGTQALHSYRNLADLAEKISRTELESRLAKLWTEIAALTSAIVLTLLLLASLILAIIRSVTTPVNQAVEKIQAVERGDLTTRLDDGANDELGILARNLNKFLETIQGIIRGMAKTTDDLQGSASDLGEASQVLAAGTEQMSAQSVSIASAATEMNQNMQTVASSTEEMSASIGEVARQSSQAAEIARHANESATNANNVIQQLGLDAKEIGKVIDGIVEIASQTNLLALNAAIEAAGAGDAGKGFAVVASEVKELARQASKSSDEIKARVSEVQSSVSAAINSIGQIATVIEKVNEITGSIASAVEEQSITTREIASNVMQSTQAANEVTKNIAGITGAAQDGARNAEKVANQATALKSVSVDLQGIVKQFKVG